MLYCIHQVKLYIIYYINSIKIKLTDISILTKPSNDSHIESISSLSVQPALSAQCTLPVISSTTQPPPLIPIWEETETFSSFVLVINTHCFRIFVYLFGNIQLIQRIIATIVIMLKQL